MAILQEQARLTDDELTVEAGATVETTVLVDPFTGISSEEVREYAVHVRGLPARWYSLSTDLLRLPTGVAAEILLVVHPPHDDPDHPLGAYEFTVELIPSTGDAPISLSARLLALAPGARRLRSRLLEYLPSIFRDDLFLGRFLLIFQSLIDPVEQKADNTHYYLDPGVTPAEFLPWLASWVGITLEPGLDEAGQRELIRQAVELHRWKGTRRGMRDELRQRTGARALIVENFDGMRIGQDASLGLNTYLGETKDGCVAVTLARAGGSTVDHQRAEELVRELKPAHVGHVVRVVHAPGAGEGVSRG